MAEVNIPHMPIINELFANKFKITFNFPHTISPFFLIREVNVRRAGAAAFQECVGRLGSFPNGIDIVQLADYFSLSNRGHAFTDIAPRIAEFNEYCVPMMEHLMAHKLGHWDGEVCLPLLIRCWAVFPLS